MKPLSPIARALVLSTAWLVAPASAPAADAERGKDIYEVCAACHGDVGQGGKRGEYPRLAGQKEKYLKVQLKAFKDRTRINIPMFPYTQEREMSDEDVADLAAYLSKVELPSEMPTFKDTDDALTRLTAMEKVMIIGRTEGDVAAGGAVYQEECAVCHHKLGLGKGGSPMLVGQYTNYLKKQMDAFTAKERPHDEAKAGGSLNNLKAEDLKNLIAYLTTLQGKKE